MGFRYPVINTAMTPRKVSHMLSLYVPFEAISRDVRVGENWASSSFLGVYGNTAWNMIMQHK